MKWLECCYAQDTVMLNTPSVIFLVSKKKKINTASEDSQKWLDLLNTITWVNCAPKSRSKELEHRCALGGPSACAVASNISLRSYASLVSCPFVASGIH